MTLPAALIIFGVYLLAQWADYRLNLTTDDRPLITDH